MTILSEKEYYRFVYNEYKPSFYESKELYDDRFEKGTYYHFLCRTRCFMVYREIAKSLKKGGKIIDLGFYPGTQVRQLKILLRNKLLCYGAGLNVEDSFKSFMKPYVENCVNVELDPFYSNSNEPIKIPLENGSFNAVIATELLEHLISPLEMISESARILKKGGFFILTTPNVSHIGALIKLIFGRSNYERLDRSPMYLQKDQWRGHCRFYDKRELITLFKRSGMELEYHRYYRELGWNHAKWPFIKKAIIVAIDKCAPIYREGHFAVFKKV